MKPAAFAYLAPGSIEEAVAQLAEHGPDARLLAGGQSLVRLMNTRVATPSVVIDVNRIAGLDAISTDDGLVRIGATARQHSCEAHPGVRARVPLFTEAGSHVAHASVRRRGTVVGSIAFADPSAELPAALLALEGKVLTRSSSGERLIDADGFFTGPFRTSLAPDELVTEVQLPATTGGRTGSAFVEVARRQGDLPMCGVGTIVGLDANGTVVSARIALCGVDQRPTRALEAERSLVGGPPSVEQLAQAAALAAEGLDPIGDCHGSAAFRRHLAAVVTRRCLQTALSRVQERSDA